MKELIEKMQIVFAALGGFLGYFLGGFDELLYALVAFTAIDYVTGVMLAIFERRLSSEIGYRGILKKVLIFMIVALGHIIDSKILGTGSAVRTAVIFFYISNEGISILENSARLGLPIPEKLKAVLYQIKKGDDGIGD